jgi:hypothetical protein
MHLVSLRGLAHHALVPAALGSVISAKSKSPAQLGNVSAHDPGALGFLM